MTDTTTNTTINPADLFRAVNVSTQNGDCLLCGEAFGPGFTAIEVSYQELGGEAAAFFLTGRRKGDGSADFRPEAQVAPRDARVKRRPQGCTCKGQKAHGAKCALYQKCACPTKQGRRGRRAYTYVKHRGGCRNKLGYADVWGNLPGFWDGFVHADCASLMGFVVPAEARRTWGRRTEGVFGGTTGAGDGTAAMAAAEELKRQESLARGRRELEAKLAAIDAAQEERFRLVFDAAFDDAPVPALEEPEDNGPGRVPQID